MSVVCDELFLTLCFPFSAPTIKISDGAEDKSKVDIFREPLLFPRPLDLMVMKTFILL
jgi:hypothetical protein